MTFYNLDLENLIQNAHTKRENLDYQRTSVFAHMLELEKTIESHINDYIFCRIDKVTFLYCKLFLDIHTMNSKNDIIIMENILKNFSKFFLFEYDTYYEDFLGKFNSIYSYELDNIMDTIPYRMGYLRIGVRLKDIVIHTITVKNAVEN